MDSNKSAEMVSNFTLYLEIEAAENIQLTQTVIASPSLPVILSRSPERSEGAAKNLVVLRAGSAKQSQK